MAAGTQAPGASSRSNRAGGTTARRRNVGSGGGGAAAAGGGSVSQSPSSGILGMRMYSEDAHGLKVGPVAVVSASFALIIIVILLHAYSKLIR
mmetsp:Transcript_11983/g.33784  ORF Transcript_11983/g.33784 Transcript_11983/m.33784 type:complete len:93 (+) Transcript_11983:92-370(+)